MRNREFVFTPKIEYQLTTERSGGGQFRSKNVRAEFYNSTKIRLSFDFLFCYDGFYGRN